MCGRIAITLPPEAIRRLFRYLEQPNFPPRHNIAPTQPLPIVRAALEDGEVVRHFALARWAFLPGFVKDPKDFPLVFNARSEGIEDKASFKNALRRRRCLVPADAFYEWHRTGSGKTARSQPYICRRRDGVTMGLAAIWETWMGPNGEEVDTVCVVTAAANAVSAAIHPRLPGGNEEADFATWLDPDETAFEAARTLLVSTGEDVLTFAPIGDGVNKAANDSADIQAPIGPPLGSAGQMAPAEAQRSLF